MLLLADLLIFTAVFLLVLSARRLVDFKYDYTMVADLLAQRRKEALAGAPFRHMIDPLVLAFAALVRRLGFTGLRARTQQHLMHQSSISEHK